MAGLGSRLPDPAVDGWPDFLAQVRLQERMWSSPVLWRKRNEPGYVGFMPFDLARFVMFLTDAVSAAPGSWFLDVGCGPGTKAAVAGALYGLQVTGIDIVPEFVEQAHRNGVQAVNCDARTFRNYSSMDIVYLNRPVQGQYQADLERKIGKAMRPGAVLISVNAAVRWSDAGWETVAEEWDAMDGVWRKPE